MIVARERQEEISANNSRFHELIRHSARNNYIINIGNTIRSIDDSVRRVANATDFDLMIRRQKEHEDILKAILKGKSGEAERMMITHIRQCVDTI